MNGSGPGLDPECPRFAKTMWWSMMRWIGTTLPVWTSTTSAAIFVMKPLMRGVRMPTLVPSRTE